MTISECFKCYHKREILCLVFSSVLVRILQRNRANRVSVYIHIYIHVCLEIYMYTHTHMGKADGEIDFRIGLR